MNCYYHPHRPAVANCPDCGKDLCHECASLYEQPICKNCNDKRKKDEIKSYSKPLIVCAILFVIGSVSGSGIGEDPILVGYIFTCIYGGWSVVSLLFSNIFIPLNFHSIFVYYSIRIIFSVLLGIFTTPIFLGYCIYKIVKAYKK